MSTGLSAGVESRTIIIPAGVMLRGDLAVPPNAKGIVVFVHGSGSSRLSPRNQRVAADLQHAGFATLLFDLLTADEESLDEWTARYRFDVEMLAQRLVRVTDWLATQPDTHGLPVGYFGASTGAAAALVAAASRPDVVRAVVSRGGRPDLAGPYLTRASAPTLLVVGGNDAAVIPLNQSALQQLNAPIKRLEIVPGATHLFEERGMLDQVSHLASTWFDTYLTAEAPPAQAASAGALVDNDDDWEIC